MTPITKERLSSGAAELDKMLGGGFLKGSTALVSGAPGVGETTLGLQFLMEGVSKGQPGLLVSFEEFPASLVRDAAQLGWDLRAIEKQGFLRIIFTSPEIFLESLKAQTGPIAEIILALGPERIVLDSMAHFRRLTQDPVALREMYNTLVNALKRQGMTSLLLDEAANILQTQSSQMSSLPFLVDAVILLRYVEVDSSMERAIAVVKMRGSNHQKEIRGFKIQQQGVEIGPPFTGKTRLLSGTPQRIG
jgi:circadian clock protein KaiC